MAQKSEDNLQIPPFIELLTIDSTNNYALSLLRLPQLTDRQAANMCGTTVFAHEQTQGKGQRGKKWESAPGENVQMSVIIAPKGLQLHQQFTLTAIIALAVRNFLAEKTGADFLIKWPNDIYFQDRKAGGILIENIIAGTEWKWAVLGIGLNINQTSFDPSLPNPVSVKQITGKNFNSVELAKELGGRVLEAVAGYGVRDSGCGVRDAGKTNVISTGAMVGERSRIKWIGETSGDANAETTILRQAQDDNQAQDDKTFNFQLSTSQLLSQYHHHLYKRGEKVKLKKDSRVFEAVIKQVTENGQLVVETGMEERFDFGEVVWVI